MVYNNEFLQNEIGIGIRPDPSVRSKLVGVGKPDYTVPPTTLSQKNLTGFSNHWKSLVLSSVLHFHLSSLSEQALSWKACSLYSDPSTIIIIRGVRYQTVATQFKANLHLIIDVFLNGIVVPPPRQHSYYWHACLNYWVTFQFMLLVLITNLIIVTSAFIITVPEWSQL